MINDKKIIPIFFATDDNYAPLLNVALKSMIENASKEYEYNIHILNMGLSIKSKSAIKKFNDGNFHIFFNNVKSEIHFKTSLLHTRDYYTKSTYYRIFIPNMFPSYDKALYLDCDIAVVGDISQLYNIDIKDNYIGGAIEESVYTVPEFIAYSETFLGLKTSEYINAGILIMNLKQLRENNFENRFVDILQKYKFTVAQDQDYINILCRDKIFFFSNEWNKTPDVNPFDVKKAMLIHYKLTYRPWLFDNVEYDDVFWHYAKQTEYHNFFVKEKKNFSADKQQKTIEVIDNLRKLAQNFSEMGELTFNRLLEKGDIKLI